MEHKAYSYHTTYILTKVDNIKSILILYYVIFYIKC